MRHAEHAYRIAVGLQRGWMGALTGQVRAWLDNAQQVVPSKIQRRSLAPTRLVNARQCVQATQQLSKLLVIAHLQTEPQFG